MAYKTRKLTYSQAIAEGLVQAMKNDKNVFLMGEGVDNIVGVNGIVLPAFKQFGERRVIDTPISENGLTGFAIGAAMDGLRPVLFHQRNDFMMLTMDQLANQAAKIPYLSAGKHKVPLTIIAYVSTKAGEGAQHNQSLQALYAHIPGLKVVMPANPIDAKGLLLSAIHDDGPVIVMYHRDFYFEEEYVPKEQYEIPLGRALIKRSGTDVTLVCISATLKVTLIAAEELSKQGIEVEVIDLRSIRPLDEKTILASVRKTGRLLVIDTGWLSFGISSEIITLVAEKKINTLKTAPRRIGMADTPAPATPSLLVNYHPTKEMVIKTVREMLK